MEIRHADEEDYPGIAGLIKNELGYENLKNEEIIERLRDIGKCDKFLTLAARLGGGVVGFIGLNRAVTYEVMGELMWILAFAVSEKCQHQGIGTKLLEAAEDYAKECDIKQLKLTSAFRRTDAHKFYESRGFEAKSYAFFKYL